MCDTGCAAAARPCRQDVLPELLLEAERFGGYTGIFFDTCDRRGERVSELGGDLWSKCCPHPPPLQRAYVYGSVGLGCV